MTTEAGRTMPRWLGSPERQRRRCFVHAKKGHDLTYKEFGTEYRRVYVEAVERGDIRITVGKSDEFDTIESGIFCLTCGGWLATWSVVDDWD